MWFGSDYQKFETANLWCRNFILGIYPKEILAYTHEEYKDCSNVSDSKKLETT